MACVAGLLDKLGRRGNGLSELSGSKERGYVDDLGSILCMVDFGVADKD